MVEARRFPPPWSVEETDACFIVRDGKGQTLAYAYFSNRPFWEGAPLVIGYVHGRSRWLVHVEHVGRLGGSFGVLRRVLNVAAAKAYHVLLSCTLLGNAHYARLDGRRRRSRSFCRRVIGSRADLGKSNCRPQ
jgi:hypothetical protein